MPPRLPAPLKVTFLGATGTVTGSKTLVESPRTRMLVDCGMYQGYKQLRLRNWDRDAALAQSIDAVVLTHAHIDHSGLLPLLVRDGFRGPIHCTPATADLLEIMLLDAAHLQEEDARRANRRGYTKHRPAKPLYATADAQAALAQVDVRPWGDAWAIGDVEVQLTPVGHLLGASSVRVSLGGRSVFFSGDVGRPSDLLIDPPPPFVGADALVLESTYGDRLHESEDALDALEHVVQRVCGRGGVLMIPSFAVGRSQALLHLLATLRAAGRIPQVPVYLNSPMAIEATRIFARHPEAHRLSEAQTTAMASAATFVRTVDESKALNQGHGPMILIAGSGMATGGRILHHLKAFAPDPANGILLVGFQAGGTRGDAIANGADRVKIHGEYVPIRAERFRMHGLSGHADYQELITWVGQAAPPDHVWINHGDPAASDGLRKHLDEALGWNAVVAESRSPYEV